MVYFIWGGFIVLIFILLALDLGVFHRKPRAMSSKEALSWTGIWILCSLVFNVLIYFFYEHNWLNIRSELGDNIDGSEAAMKFFTGYVIEKALSVDNIFVMALIFTYFKIPLKYQHVVLFWGILGALVFRGIMIFLGVALINNFTWITYVFGALLIYSAIQMLVSKDDGVEPDKNPFIKLIRKIYPVSDTLNEGNFFTRINGKKAATPMFIVLIVIETSDIMFAIDSIPAIFAVTTDPFLVFTSNVFAILGLRSLYFVLASVLDKFHYLKVSLVFVLGFVGVKMLIMHFYHLPTWISLCIILGILTAGVLTSLFYSGQGGENTKNEPSPQPQEKAHEHINE